MKNSITTKALMIFILMGLPGIFSCSQNSDNSADPASNSTSESGQGGSLARFAIVGDYLYAVDNENLNLLDISNPNDPADVSESRVGFGIETIFPRDEETLFMGSERGMYIYDISSPLNPQEISMYEHVVSCDPVVADQQYAYVTLNDLEGRCNRAENMLQVIDIEDLEDPRRVHQRTMNGPQGLGIKNDQLFVCDNGLKVFDVSTPTQGITLEQHFHDIEARDVIPLDEQLLVIAKDALVQYNYTGDKLEELSRIPVQPSDE